MSENQETPKCAHCKTGIWKVRQEGDWFVLAHSGSGCVLTAYYRNFNTKAEALEACKLLPLYELVGEMKELLKEISQNVDIYVIGCPVCFFEAGEGHSDNCELSPLLKKLEAK